jgi:hypothetical protein
MNAMRRPAAALALLVGLAGAPGTAAGQAAGTPGRLPVEAVGASDYALDRRLDRLLEGEFFLVARDTMIAEGDTLPGPVLVLDATLILEGVIAGDLVLVDAGAFVRPDAVVRGDLVNMGGGLYRSELARIGGTILDYPTAGYRVTREPDRYLIEASDYPSPITLDGAWGFHLPTYDRVNGLTAIWGARLQLPRLGELTPSVHGQAGWQTERGDPTYAASAELRWRGTALEGGWERAWDTNDAWIRDDGENSLNYLWNAKDVRNYHEVERGWAEVRRELGDEEKAFYAVLGVRGQVEDATSLEGGQPWNLWGDSARANPAIDDGRISSIITSVALEWHGQETDFEGRVEYEAAREWADGLSDFDRVRVDGEWAMHALANHTLEIDFVFQHPLGGGILPRQRWSFVGGSGTLQTVPFARFQGDRLIYTESKYVIPMPERLAIPILGAPELQLLHASGMAWVEGEDPAYRQEVGARVVFFGLYVRYMVDPADTGNQDLDISVTWPFDSSYPWERR